MALELRELTVAQLITAFRERYRVAEKDQVAKLAAWLLYRMDVNDLDDQAVRAEFGLSPSQWNQLLIRMRKAAEAYAVIQDARGE